MQNPLGRLCIIASLVVASINASAGDPAISAHTNDRQLQQLLDQDIPRLLTENQVASVSIARLEHGQLVFAAAYGSQSPGVPATTKTLYNIASMTKPISAEVILRLASAGRLNLDEPMAPVWTDPDIAKDERRDLLTPRIALSHQTGFPNWRRETGGILAFKRAPGAAFGYSGEGYEYVARFAQAKTRTDFEALAQTQIFDPLGMHDTAYTRRPWFEGRIALPADAHGQFLTPHIASRWVASDLLYTTPSDYAKFLQAVMMGAGLTPALATERRRIQVSQKTGMCSGNKAKSCPNDVGFGLGWQVMRFDGRTFFMHTGMDEGVFTLGYVNLDDRSGSVIFSNSANGPKLVLPILDRLGKDATFIKFLHGQAG